jgi:PiT family inorganic phosphate transporter
MLLAGFYAFWMGGNDMANAVAPLVGGGVLDFKKAAILFTISMAIGAFVQGYMVTVTLGKGVVPNISVYEGIVASVATIIWIAIATIKGMPISTTQSIVSGVVGIGLFRFLVKGIWCLNLGVVWRIILSWVLSPLTAILIAWATCSLLLRYGSRLSLRLKL